ncbi:MAG: hypothetical protein AAF318_11405 [Pseudomonadota bacterium]
MSGAPFEAMLTGGHPNSLGQTVAVVEAVLGEPSRVEALFRCYESDDAVVRLRTSNAMMRVEAVRHDLLVPYIDRFLALGSLDQASAQWTLAKLFHRLADDMTPAQKQRAAALMKTNLAQHGDWIVLINTMETLTAWAAGDPSLRAWLRPELARHCGDRRKSVSGRAAKLSAALS